MTSWLHRIRTEISPQKPSQPSPQTQTPLTPRAAARTRDPNSPDYRFNINQKCIYERRLPGGSFITAHIQRLQSGYYDSPMVHEDRIDNVRFIAINFVFHPSRSNFRFKSAEISIALHRDSDEDRPDIAVPASIRKLRNASHSSGSLASSLRNGPNAHDSQALVHSSHAQVDQYHQQKQRSAGVAPRFLRHAPHLLFGAISPETLNWNFNLAGSLGVSQGPANASISPSGGMTGSYKLYEMMRIQGSVRGLHRWFDQTYDIEDGEIVWTLEENRLQKSGLPREFTFVMLLTKGSDDVADGLGHVKLDLDIKPVVAGFMGISNASYPNMVTNMMHYKPLHKDLVDLDREVGQRFQPEIPGKGFNFAMLEKDFDEFVWLPGTTWSTKEGGRTIEESGQQPAQADGSGNSQGADGKAQGGTPAKATEKSPQLSLLGTGDNTLNLRVILDSSRGSPIPALPYGSLNFRAQPPYPSSRGPSPAIPAPTSTTSSRPSKTDSKRRSITIVSAAHPSGGHQRHSSRPDSQGNHNSGSNRQISRSPTLRRRTSRSSLDKEFRSSPPGPQQSNFSGQVRPHTMHEPFLQTQQLGADHKQRPLSWYTHSSTSPPPRTANSEATDTGTVVHHPSEPASSNVAHQRASHQSERVKTRQSKVTQTPYPADTPATAGPESGGARSTLRYGDELSDKEYTGHQTLGERSVEPDVPIIAVPRKSSKRASQALLAAASNSGSNSNSSSTSGSNRNSYYNQATDSGPNGGKNGTNAANIPGTSASPGAEPAVPAAKSNRGTVVFTTPANDHHHHPQDSDRTPTNAHQSAPSAQPPTYGQPSFARSASGVFHDASEELPEDGQGGTEGENGASREECNERNVF